MLRAATILARFSDTILERIASRNANLCDPKNATILDEFCDGRARSRPRAPAVDPLVPARSNATPARAPQAPSQLSAAH